ncbi:exo-alpha-sialidase [Paenibacillus sp. PAMC21692]|uniref:exo-alpha-sialidase n=1 Tax=Paenibacillus sp. PAMC21692 TaxID=2762320 RepID=UPI00164D5A52|nr:exo-alpha-sialidase [Paenibacillus sp. PAMC21692]QNK58952.1 exo-alpha-sialidase [Paenibacillus sp. PAMC21692]
MRKISFMLLMTLLASLFASSLQASAYIDPDRAVNPVFETTVVEANQTTITKRAFNGAIIELKQNELLLTYDNYSDVEDDSPGVISGKISQDGGRTWGESYLIQENIGLKNVANQGVVRLKSGDLALFFYKQDDSTHISMHMIRSSDEGRTWSEPINITPLEGHHPTGNDRAVVLSSGRIIIPLGGNTPSIPGKSGVFTVYSDDEGETWQFGDFVDWTTGYPSEPVLVELKDHRVMILIRTTVGHIIKAYSDDGGETWGEPIETDIQTASSPYMIKRIPDNGMGPLMLIWNNSPNENRRPLTMAVSNDEGETWTNYINLEPADRGINAYPSITTYRDEVLITYYTYSPYPDGTYTLPLKLQIWKLADITAGTGFGNATSLTSNVSSASPGETFKVKYGLSSVAAEVYAQDISLIYDPATLEYVSATSLKPGAKLLETTTTPAGSLQLILASTGEGNAIKVPGDIVEITFKSKSVSEAVTSEIKISSAVLANGQGIEYTAATSAVNIQITPGLSGDLNHDQKISVGDLAIIAANYGKDTNSPDWNQVKQADLNGDGKIDIVDLVTQAKKIKR